MSLEEFHWRPIGTIHSPFAEPRGTPIQSTAGKAVRASVEVLPEYAEGLRDLDGFSHIILLYYFHRAAPYSLSVVPFMDSEPHGVFATRAPARPNPIGISVVRLVERRGNVLEIEEVDILDGTPLLDIKPFVSEFDARRHTRKGWLGRGIRRLRRTRDDARFAGPP
jgi:tRNA-Thr(GGU) m(6)t(6)A37 methyltransferase TsaA